MKLPQLTLSSPHLHGDAALDRLMQQVAIALIPAIAVNMWVFGWGVITNIFITLIVSLGSEAIAVALRRRSVAVALSDYSAVVTALLLGLTLPPLSPWWLLVTGSVAAIIFAKHLYGGLGFNPFNPAMVGFVVLLISFPVEMTRWQAPFNPVAFDLGFFGALTYVFSGHLPFDISLDALTMATPLDHLKTGLSLQHNLSEIRSNTEVFGMVAGKGWEWANLAILAGGLWLLYQRIITWHAPVTLLVTLATTALIFNLIDPARYADPLFHLLSGGTILGAFFIVTDPVTGATSVKGRIIFAAGVALIVYIIRNWGGFPDGIAFAVLLMNMAAPTIDYYTRPRVIGHHQEERQP
ncbi:MAG: electron transport complex subunit RsxD [Gammaproteobacteria bacterium]|nr:electron transport complex subunit RsxD [Gammaproteobacteria bacterium]